MALPAITRSSALFIGAISLISVCIVVLLHEPLQSVELQFTSLKYTLRGDIDADTNIVVIYIDDDAIKTLGWPVPRNFYAVMIKALGDLQARAVGIEVLFEDRKLEYPEYDNLLASVVASAKNVVLPCYFQVVNASDGSRGPGDTPRNQFEGVHDVEWAGEGLHLPIEGLLNGAAGVGHLNFMEDTAIPVFILSHQGPVPAFGVEVLRVASSANAEAVTFVDGTLSIPQSGRSDILLHTSPSGFIELNYPGRISAFRIYPFIEVLKSYDAYVTGQTPSIPVVTFKDKIVLVGVVAQGRSAFLWSPIDPRYPSIGVHAVFLENVLQNRTQRSAGMLSVYILCFLTALAFAGLVLCAPAPYSRVFVPVVIAGIAAILFFLFTGLSYQFPFAPLLVSVVTSSLGALLYKHRLTREQLKGLEIEKETIVAQLRDKEAKVAALERELQSAASQQTGDRTKELLAEIRRYKGEIHELSAKADDLVVHVIDDGGVVNYEGIVGASGGKMKKVTDFIEKIADSEASVLILGESGTGKELVARALHKRSRRSAGPFIAVNCGALSEGILESELFGHEKGAFTGAVKEKPGRFELADGGTIFLDEIGEVSESFQVKLLRVLQEGELERVGGTVTLRVNVRVLAASNRDLKSQIATKKFREDLYYRLNVLSIELSPLRERGEDIDLLVQHFLLREGTDLSVSRNVMNVLQIYSWPGNVRELESVIKRGVLMAKAEGRAMLTMKDLADEIRAAAQASVDMEVQVIQALREKEFSRSAISEAADELGLNRGTIAEYLRGQCLRAFVENGFDLEATVRSISLSGEPSVHEKVKKKILEYLTNINDVVDPSQPWEGVEQRLKPKTKNLPQRYHSAVEGVAEAIYKGRWKL